MADPEKRVTQDDLDSAKRAGWLQFGGCLLSLFVGACIHVAVKSATGRVFIWLVFVGIGGTLLTYALRNYTKYKNLQTKKRQQEQGAKHSGDSTATAKTYKQPTTLEKAQTMKTVGIVIFVFSAIIVIPCAVHVARELDFVLFPLIFFCITAFCGLSIFVVKSRDEKRARGNAIIPPVMEIAKAIENYSRYGTEDGLNDISAIFEKRIRPNMGHMDGEATRMYGLVLDAYAELFVNHQYDGVKYFPAMNFLFADPRESTWCHLDHTEIKNLMLKAVDLIDAYRYTENETYSDQLGPVLDKIVSYSNQFIHIELGRWKAIIYYMFLIDSPAKED